MYSSLKLALTGDKKERVKERLTRKHTLDSSDGAFSTVETNCNSSVWVLFILHLSIQTTLRNDLNHAQNWSRIHTDKQTDKIITSPPLRIRAQGKYQENTIPESPDAFPFIYWWENIWLVKLIIIYNLRI